MDQENQRFAGESNSENSSENSGSTRPMRKAQKDGLSMFKLVIGIIVIVLIAVGAWAVLNKKSPNIEVSGGVAIVNGETISGTAFEEFYTKQKALLGSSQINVEESVLKQQILDLLISKTILLQKVKEEGITITDAEVDSQISQVKSQFPDEQKYSEALTEQGFTEQSFRSALSEDLIIQKYINSQIDVNSVTVTDEEVQAEYDLALTKQADLPGIDVLGGPIKAQLLQQKQQQLITQLIEKLKSESSIEITEAIEV